MHWDLFCRVIDNFGDIGVCWRLAADLAARGDSVRLWIDDASALAWMAPHGARGVEVRAWPADDDATIEPHEVVIEAFGCHLPAGFLRAHGGARTAADLDQPRVSERRELCRSATTACPRRRRAGRPGPAQVVLLSGFTANTGGLLREPDLFQRQAAFEAERLAARAVDRRRSPASAE